MSSGSHKQDISVHDDLEGSQQQEFKLARDEDGIAIEVPPGAVIWFHSHLLHKSTDNYSQRFRRSFVSHYLSAQVEGTNPEKPGRGQPIMWFRGQTFAGKVQEVEREILPVTD
jgi:ectoine hydroxylase-related dioxygenase (phytanoyl-CoA dioxygenase family)